MNGSILSLVAQSGTLATPRAVHGAVGRGVPRVVGRVPYRVSTGPVYSQGQYIAKASTKARPV